MRNPIRKSISFALLLSGILIFAGCKGNDTQIEEPIPPGEPYKIVVSDIAPSFTDQIDEIRAISIGTNWQISSSTFDKDGFTITLPGEPPIAHVHKIDKDYGPSDPNARWVWLTFMRGYKDGATTSYYLVCNFYTANGDGGMRYIYVDRDVTLHHIDQVAIWSNVKLKQGWNRVVEQPTYTGPKMYEIRPNQQGSWKLVRGGLLM